MYVFGYNAALLTTFYFGLFNVNLTQKKISTGLPCRLFESRKSGFVF